MEIDGDFAHRHRVADRSADIVEREYQQTGEDILSETHMIGEKAADVIVAAP